MDPTEAAWPAIEASIERHAASIRERVAMAQRRGLPLPEMVVVLSANVWANQVTLVGPRERLAQGASRIFRHPEIAQTLGEPADEGFVSVLCTTDDGWVAVVDVELATLRVGRSRAAVAPS